MSKVLKYGEVVFEGTHDQCVEYAKYWGIMKWVDFYQCWLVVGDAAII